MSNIKYDTVLFQCKICNTKTKVRSSDGSLKYPKKCNSCNLNNQDFKEWSPDLWKVIKYSEKL